MAAIFEAGKLTLSGFVGDDMFDDGFSYAQVLTALAEADGDLVVHINSGGGIATDGSAIHALLAARPGRTDVVIDGIAASAASLIAMAGDTVTMSLGSVMMVHDPATITLGTASDHAKSAEALNALGTTYARVYAQKTGGTVEDARAIMQAETWMTPEQAVEQGFADAIGQNEAQPVAAMDYRAYAHAPQRLITAAVDNGWQVKRKAAASAVVSTAVNKEIQMTDKERADNLAAELETLKAQMKSGETADAAAALQEELDTLRADKEARENADAVMALDSAKGRETQAKALADAGVKADAADKILAAAPKPDGNGAPAPANGQPTAEYEAARAAGAGLGGQPTPGTSAKAKISPTEIYAARRAQ